MYKFEILPQVLVPELADRFPLTTRCCACDHAVGQVTGVAAFYNVERFYHGAICGKCFFWDDTLSQTLWRQFLKFLRIEARDSSRDRAARSRAA